MVGGGHGLEEALPVGLEPGRGRWRERGRGNAEARRRAISRSWGGWGGPRHYQQHVGIIAAGTGERVDCYERILLGGRRRERKKSMDKLLISMMADYFVLLLFPTLLLRGMPL